MSILILPFLTLIAAHGAVGGTAPPAWSHTRPVTPLAASLLAEAGTRAPAVRLLLDALERTDVVVYVSHHLSLSVSEPPAFLRFVTRAGGTRYLSVEINCWRVRDIDRLASLGHELQHALEVAAAPDVQDTEGLVRLYRRIGWEVRPRQYETRAARAIGNRVRKELSVGRP